jgi:hypothetical protein
MPLLVGIMNGWKYAGSFKWYGIPGHSGRRKEFTTTVANYYIKYVYSILFL